MRELPMKLRAFSTTATHYVLELPMCLKYEGWNFNSGNYLFKTDTKYIHVSKFYCTSM